MSAVQDRLEVRSEMGRVRREGSRFGEWASYTDGWLVRAGWFGYQSECRASGREYRVDLDCGGGGRSYPFTRTDPLALSAASISCRPDTGLRAGAGSIRIHGRQARECQPSRLARQARLVRAVSRSDTFAVSR